MNRSNKRDYQDIHYIRTCVIGIFLYVGVIISLTLLDTVLPDWSMSGIIFFMIVIICMILGLLRIDKAIGGLLE